MVKKLYNPFKMWGSWIGFIIIPIRWVLGLTVVRLDFALARLDDFLWYFNPVYYLERSLCHEAGCGFITSLSTPIVFFLIGWGIHSLIRSLKK
jgi:hypothetical protein